MNATKVLEQLELVLEENSIEVDSIVLRKNREVTDSIVLDDNVSIWFNEGSDYSVRYEGDHVLTTSSLTLALDKVVEIDARKTSLHYVMDSVRASKLNDKLNIDEDRIRELLYRYRLTETDKKVLEVFDTYRQYNQTSRVLGMDSFIVTSTIERYGLEYKLLTNTERPVKCITIDRVFNNIQEAKEWCGLTSNGLEKVLKGRRKYAGKYKGQLLEWEYVDY